MEKVLWECMLGESEWTSTPIEDIRVDVHTNGNTVSLPLTMLVDLIYPLIEKRLDRSISLEIHATKPLDAEAIAKAFS